MTGKNPAPSTVDAYLAAFPAAVQARLTVVRETIQGEVPDAAETISYGMPAYRVGGKGLVYFGGYREHIGLYPVPRGDAALVADIAPFHNGKGTLRFPHARPLPLDLIARVVRALAAEHAAHEKGTET